MYVAYGVVCAFLFTQLIRSVVGDLYGQSVVRLQPAPATPMACLEDVDRLYAELASRAVQPAPGGVSEGVLSREFDTWSRRWEAEIEGVSSRCKLEDAHEPALQDLSDAMDALDELRRVLGHSAEDVTRQSGKVRDALAAARGKLRVR